MQLFVNHARNFTTDWYDIIKQKQNFPDKMAMLLRNNYLMKRVDHRFVLTQKVSAPDVWSNLDNIDLFY